MCFLYSVPLQQMTFLYCMYRQSSVKIPPIRNISSNNTLHIYTPFHTTHNNPGYRKNRAKVQFSYSNSNNPITYFHWKIIAIAGISTGDLTYTKPICYHLSYPGLDDFIQFHKNFPLNLVKKVLSYVNPHKTVLV